MIRNNGAGASYLRLAKDERKNRNIKVAFCDSQQAPSIIANKRLYCRNDFGRVKLLAFSMKGEARIETGSDDLGAHAKLLAERLPQPFQQTGVNITHRQQLQLPHRVSIAVSSRSRRLQPYLFNL